MLKSFSLLIWLGLIVLGLFLLESLPASPKNKTYQGNNQNERYDGHDDNDNRFVLTFDSAKFGLVFLIFFFEKDLKAVTMMFLLDCN